MGLRPPNTRVSVAVVSGDEMGQTAQIILEYLMTLHADLDPPQAIDAANLIFNVKGGWAEGPKVKGKLLAPAADWLQILPSGVWRLDVRGTVATEDGQMIYVSYNGVIAHSKASADKMAAGLPITQADAPYFATAPTFRTAAEKYSWLNAIQGVGKMVGLSTDPANSFVRYDIFAVH
jgi:hypothetical protein